MNRQIKIQPPAFWVVDDEDYIRLGPAKPPDVGEGFFLLRRPAWSQQRLYAPVRRRFFPGLTWDRIGFIVQRHHIRTDEFALYAVRGGHASQIEGGDYPAWLEFTGAACPPGECRLYHAVPAEDAV